MDFFLFLNMKKLIFFLVFYNFIFSQEIPAENYFWQLVYHDHQGKEETSEAVIGVKNCYIREDASTNSTLLDSLQIGHKIKVLKDSEKYLNIKGLNLSWIEIEYQKNNQTKKGFLWKGFIALNATKDKNLTFITTIDRKFSKKIKHDDYDYEASFYGLTAKVINEKNEILGEKSISKDFSESIYNYASVIDNWGLKNINSIYRVSFTGGACGVPSYHYYFGWNGKDFLLLPEKFDVSDAGAYYHIENFIFPKEKGGQANTIIKEITESENIDTESEEYIFKVTKEIEYYSWDGKNFKLIKTKKLKPYTQKED